MVAGDLPYLSFSEDRRFILIAGPTGSGKSALAMHLASRQDAMIVNADALQVYDCWRLLTARPGPEDEGNIRHALYGYVPFDKRHSVGSWLSDLARLIKRYPRKLMIVVGGTGLYFTALTDGLAPIPDTDGEIEAVSEEILQRYGPERLLKDLSDLDPETYRTLDHENPVRVQRAWVVLRQTGRGLASWHAETPTPLISLEEAHPVLLTAERRWLIRRINKRVRHMVEAGVLDECEAMLPWWDPTLNSSRAIGAVEFMAYLRGELLLEQAIKKVEIATRQYAKRQRTWFRSRFGLWQAVDARLAAHGLNR